MRRLLRILAGLGLALALVGTSRGPGRAAAEQRAPGDTPPASQNPPDQQTPVFRTGINFVRVDVIVSDRSGQLVASLTEDDFEVTEDGKPQAIETFKLVRLDGGATPATDGQARPIRTGADEEVEAARDDVRLFAIFLDDYHVRREASLSVREPLTAFIQTRLGPSDMLAVMAPLDPVSSVRMTRDRSAAVRSVAQFMGRKWDYTPRNAFEMQYARASAETAERIRTQVSLSAIEGLIVHLGSLKEGRKALILVSEGFSNTLPPQLRDRMAGVPDLGNPDRQNPMAGAREADSLRSLAAGSDLQQDLRDVYNAANRHNVAIYPVDPRGLAAVEFGLDLPAINMEVDRQYLNATLDTLRQLADETDGRAIVSRNDLGNGLAQVVRDTSGYYLLGYTSGQPSDGKFHEIKVRVKRPGVQVRARRGYWALAAEDAARAVAATPARPPTAVDNALSMIAAPRAGRAAIQSWIGTSRGDDGRTRVTFVWEPTPLAPGEPARDVAARVMVTAVGPDGTPYFRGRVPEAAASSPQPSTGGGPAPAGGANGPARPASRVTFDAPPGRMQLRLSVEGASSQVLDSEAREITVPDLTAPGAVLGTPQVFRARTARDYQQLKGDADAVPVVTRVFRRADRLLIRIPAYGAGAAEPMLSVRLLSRAGRMMAELEAAASPVGGWQEVELPLAGLAGGEYVLEITAAGGGSEGRPELLGFRVTS